MKFFIILDETNKMSTLLVRRSLSLIQLFLRHSAINTYRLHLNLKICQTTPNHKV